MGVGDELVQVHVGAAYAIVHDDLCYQLVRRGRRRDEVVARFPLNEHGRVAAFHAYEGAEHGSPGAGRMDASTDAGWPHRRRVRILLIASVAAVVAGLAAWLVLAGVTHHDPVVVGADQTTSQADTAQATAGPPNTCVIYLAGADISVTVTGGSDNSECDALISSLSQGGEYWSYTYHAPYEQTAIACAMQHDGYTAEVWDSGSQIYGHGLCSSFLSAGWIDVTGTSH